MNREDPIDRSMLPDMPKPKAVDFTVIEDSEQKEPIRFEPISDEQYQSMMKEATSQKQLNQLTQKARPDGSIETETSTVSSKEMSDILDKQDKIEDAVQALPRNIAEEQRNG